MGILDKIYQRITASNQNNAKSFSEAYGNARSEGFKTFIYNGKHYSTDYSGGHHKQYENDVKSGKAARWEAAYPGYTNPELRKAKQEELDTYGITNEQTKNKTFVDKALKRIPARGYDISDAISGILNEHTKYKSYKNNEEYFDAIRKKHPEFKDFPFKEYYSNLDKDSLSPFYHPDSHPIVKRYLEQKLYNKDVYPFLNDLREDPSSNSKEAHRSEFNFLLGYPILKNDNSAPSISKYRTGNNKYYFTTNEIESSRPFLPDDFINPRILRESKMKKLYERLSASAPSLENFKVDGSYDYDKYHESKKTNPEIWEEYNKIDKELNKYIIEDETLSYDIYDNKDKYESFGVSANEGIPYILDRKLFLESDSKLKQDLIKRGMIPIYNPNYETGNHVSDVSSTSSGYYTSTINDKKINGKYSNLAKILQERSNKINGKNKEFFNDATLRTGNLLNTSSLGTYTVGVPEDKKYISVWDKFDIDPFGSGNDKPIIKVGAPFEYYTRFYKHGEEPDIDDLYKHFK